MLPLAAQVRSPPGIDSRVCPGGAYSRQIDRSGINQRGAGQNAETVDAPSRALSAGMTAALGVLIACLRTAWEGAGIGKIMTGGRPGVDDGTDAGREEAVERLPGGQRTLWGRRGSGREAIKVCD